MEEVWGRPSRVPELGQESDNCDTHLTSPYLSKTPLSYYYTPTTLPHRVRFMCAWGPDGQAALLCSCLSLFWRCSLNPAPPPHCPAVLCCSCPQRLWSVTPSLGMTRCAVQALIGDDEEHGAMCLGSSLPA